MSYITYGMIALKDLEECRRIPYYDASNSYCLHLHYAIEKLLKHLIDKEIAFVECDKSELLETHDLNRLLCVLTNPIPHFPHWDDMCSVYTDLVYPNDNYKVVSDDFVYGLQRTVKSFLEWFVHYANADTLAKLLIEKADDIHLETLSYHDTPEWRAQVAGELGLIFDEWLLLD